MNRRSFIKTFGSAMAASLFSPWVSSANLTRQLQMPDRVDVLVKDKLHPLVSNDNRQWFGLGVSVSLVPSNTSLGVDLQAPGVPLSKVTLTWKIVRPDTHLILDDHWERTYGDVSWQPLVNNRASPWYFLEMNGEATYGFGVKTEANSFCYWTVSNSLLTLTLDTRSGAQGVVLNNRVLRAADIVIMTSNEGETPFQAARRFMRIMCAKPRMPKQPVYGINDWYFSYGNTSEKLILQHTALMAPLAGNTKNRPFSVIDAGWFAGNPQANDDCCWGDNMHTPDKNFSDMGKLAEKINELGMRPGIWTRPLCASYKDPTSLLLPSIPGRNNINQPVLDPSIPENLERVKNYFKLYNQWRYELVKFDFTTYDIFGRWGFEMLTDQRMTQGQWRMYDNTKTNAEIILDLYRAIRAAAGETYLLGCNTISHLSAGLFEINRIGDDTSGNDWSRTRKMGVNALAFRGMQHGAFYSADADCVGLTTQIDWNRNKQWMELLAKSGTPLFISAQPDAVGEPQKKFIRECFSFAARELPLAEPLDWQNTLTPNQWKLNGTIRTFNWE